MKAKGGVWDEAALDAYLADPMKTVTGTRMAFAGAIDPADRKALILSRKQQSECGAPSSSQEGPARPSIHRKSHEWGKRVYVRVGLAGRSTIKTKPISLTHSIS